MKIRLEVLDVACGQTCRQVTLTGDSFKFYFLTHLKKRCIMNFVTFGNSCSYLSSKYCGESSSA
jgi:hypothetical protein